MNVKLIGGSKLRKELFLPTVEGEARLLILIDAFTGRSKSLEGRTKLAKLDFLLRHPTYLARMLQIRSQNLSKVDSDIMLELSSAESFNVENQMIRYRYGPWDPSYFAILGRLIGKGLVEPVSIPNGIGYKSTANGRTLAQKFTSVGSWEDIASRAKLLRKYLDLRGTTLKNLIYEHFPEVSAASWGEKL